jgi:hypothetical protein
MERFVTYAAGMYWYLSEIISEIQIFNFGYLSSGPVYIRKLGCEDLWLFFETKRGPRAKYFVNLCSM